MKTPFWIIAVLLASSSAFPARATTVVGDMNGDSKPDFVLFDPVTRKTEYDLLSGTALTGKQAGRTLLPGLKLVAVADLDGDGIMDYLMVNNSRMLIYGTRSTAGTITTRFGPALPAGYEVAFVADMNGDHRQDVVLFNATTRTVRLLLMHGVNPLSGSVYPIGYQDAPGPVPDGYRLVGIADVDRNGTPDYILAAAGSATIVWFMGDGVYRNTLKAVAVAPAGVDGYQVIGVGDFNYDGKLDLVLLKTPGSGQPQSTQFRFLQLTISRSPLHYTLSQIGPPVAGPSIPANWSVVFP